MRAAQRRQTQRPGLTLVELILVVAILAVLAMIILPKLDGVQSNANHAVGATSASDTARYIQSYRAMNQRFPDGYDSLTDGTALAQLADDPSTHKRGLHASAFASTGKFTTATLSAADVASLQAVGIVTLYNLGTIPTGTGTGRASDMFTAAATISTSSAVVIPNASTSGGRKIIDHVYRDNLKPGGTSGAIPSGRKLIALGFGQFNQLIGTFMLECPMYPNVDHRLVYARNLALFDVGGSRAVFKSVVAADGDLIDDMATYMSRVTE